VTAHKATQASPSKHIGWHHLCILFVLVLLLFLPLRWDFTPWLRGQIMTAATNHGLILGYQKLEFDGLSVRLRQVQIKSAAMSVPLLFDSIRLAPAWMDLLQARLSAHINVIGYGIQATTIVFKDGQSIVLKGVRIEADANDVMALAKQALPIQVGGRLLIIGDMHLDATNGRPLSGALRCQWKHAAISLVGKPDLLGDYILSIHNKLAATPWQWSLSGGDGVIAKGEGTLTTQGLPQQWLANGQVELSGSPAMPDALKPLLRQPMHFGLTGTLSALRLQSR